MADNESTGRKGDMGHVFFQPWVGKDYGVKSRWGVPVMILGESHNCDENEAKNRDFTVNFVDWIANDGGRYAFLTKTAGLFCDRDSAKEAIATFWNSVIFYEYIQESVGPKARMRPSSEAWKRAEAGFLEVVNYHCPGFVLVLGKGLRDHLPVKDHPGPPIRLPDGKQRETWLYPHRDGEALAMWINHPASFGWKRENWAPWVLAALDQARVRQHRSV